MKNFKKLAMLGAVALTSTVLFTACSSDEDVALNPTYDGSSVKTSFTLSMGNVSSKTRMSYNAVQPTATATFQGLSEIYLFPTKAATTFTATTPFAEDYINLPDFTSFDLAESNAKIYKDVSFSLGVQGFLFYASIASGSEGNGDLKPNYLDPNLLSVNSSTTPADIQFNLVPLKTATGTVSAHTEAVQFLKTLNDVDAALTTAIGSATEGPLVDIQTKIQNGGQLFAGSANSMKILFEDLYTSLKRIGASASAVVTAFDDSGIGTLADGDSDGQYEFSSWTYTFPADWNLPDGAVAIAYQSGAFAYANYTDGQVPYGTLALADVDKYVKPAKLYYTINTPGMVKDEEFLSTNPAGNWATVKSNGAYAEGAVKATTKSVILEDQVEFAVARLDVQARVKPNVVIKDNGSNITGAADKDPQIVTVPSDGYKLTGVLVGDQKNVDWQFLPTGSDVYTIFDNVMTKATEATPTQDFIAVKQQTGYSDINTTLVLESAGSNAPVNIALEFENTGNTFYGVNHGIIPAGSKFYLVAKLTPGTNSEGSLTQVFKQDYTTTAKLTINETSLKNAYNVIPDLRSPKLEFGLSVNLEWQSGLTFTQDFQ